MANSKLVALKGSERVPLAGAHVTSPTDPHQLIEISVVLKNRQSLNAAKSTGQFLSHNEFASQYGADPASVDRMRQFAQDNRLQMLERGDEVLRRTVTLAGTAAQMEKAFGVELNEYEHPDGSYRGRNGTMQIPEDCANIIQGVFGLDDRAVAQPHFRYRSASRAFGARISNTTFFPTEVAKFYNFPRDVNGTGQVIGLIELGAGYRPADIQRYFQSQNLQPPVIKTAAVNGAKNRPSTADSADGQVLLDIQMAGSIAPGATIVVYFAPNTERGFQDALSMAVHDQLRGPRTLCIGWGAAEETWTKQSLQCFNEVAQEAAMLGITIAVASGDCGSNDAIYDGQNHVDFPASSPNVLSCGGTQLAVANGSVKSETVWNDGVTGGTSGGGYSQVFERPAWQTNSSQTGRGVPDVCGNADPNTGYEILVDGERMVVGGTSAVAAMWAGLLALCGQKAQSRVGFLNPALYGRDQSNCFKAVTAGSNGAYSAGQGWNPASGLGSPQGTQIVNACQASVQAHGNRESQRQSTTSR